MLALALVALPLGGAAEMALFQEAKLSVDLAAFGEDCGISVAGSNSMVAVAVDLGLDVGLGQHNRAYVFTRKGDGWAREAKLAAPGTIDADHFGASIALANNTILVGASGLTAAGDRAGAAYVFSKPEDEWQLQAILSSSRAASGDAFGQSVALSGNLALVGAPGNGTSTRGAAHVFMFNGSSWIHQAVLEADDVTPSDYYGDSVALFDDFALIGAPYHNEQRGAAYMFIRSGANWTLHTKFSLPQAVVNDQFGCSLAMTGHTAMIGALGHSLSAGAVFIFKHESSVWIQKDRLVAPDAISGMIFGTSIAMTSELAIIGAAGTTSAGGSRSGMAHLYAIVNGTWTLQANLSAEDAAPERRFGRSVAFLDEAPVVGSCRLDDTDPYSAYVFNQDHCKPSHCGPGLVLKPLVELPTQCAGTSCTWQECCEPVDVCGTEDCMVPGFLQKMPPPACASTSCTQTECCDAQGICTADLCVTAWTPKLSFPSYCNGTVCTIEECCDRMGVCMQEDCYLGYVMKKEVPTNCSSRVCNVTECCDPAASCPALKYYCPSPLITRFELPAFCNGTSCAVDECCQARVVCTSDHCSSASILQVPPRSCAGTACTEDECCYFFGRCSAHDCRGNGLAVKEELPEFCTEQHCIQEECCQPVFGTCSPSDCTEGQVPKVTLPDICSAWKCSEAECCGPQPECSLLDCGFGLMLRSAGILCQKTKCTPEECCDEERSEPSANILTEVMFSISVGLSLCLGAVAVVLCVLLARKSKRAAKKVMPEAASPTGSSSTTIKINAGRRHAL